MLHACTGLTQPSEMSQLASRAPLLPTLPGRCLLPTPANPTPDMFEAHCCGESFAYTFLRRLGQHHGLNCMPSLLHTELPSPCHGLNCASDAARLSRPHATRLERTRRETSRLRRGSRGVNPVPAALWGDWVGATVPLLPQAGRPSSTGSAPPCLTELTDRAPSRDERGDRLSCRANAWPCKARRGPRLLPDGVWSLLLCRLDMLALGVRMLLAQAAERRVLMRMLLKQR